MTTEVLSTPPASGTPPQDGDTSWTRPVRRIALVALIVLVMAGPAVFVALRAQDGAANFADDERLGRNRLTAARLDIEPGDRTVPIVTRNLAPGDTATGTIEFTNAGTLDLRYSVRVGAASGADARALAPWMTWQFIWIDAGQPCPRAASHGLTLDGAQLVDGRFISGDSRTGGDAGDRILRIGESDVLCMQATLALDAPNSVQGVTLRHACIADAEQLDPSPNADGES